MRKRINLIVVLGILMALQIVISRFLSIQLPNIKIGFGFLPTAVASMLFGPWIGAGFAALCDYVGGQLFLPPGTYFYPMMLTYIFGGMIFGFCLHQRPLKTWNIALAAALNCLILYLFLQTYWLSLLWKTPYWIMLQTRLWKIPIDLVIQFVLMRLVLPPVRQFYEKI